MVPLAEDLEAVKRDWPGTEGRVSTRVQIQTSEGGKRPGPAATQDMESLSERRQGEVIRCGS